MTDNELHLLIADLIGAHNEQALQTNLLEILCTAFRWQVGEIWMAAEDSIYMQRKFVWCDDMQRYQELIRFGLLCKFAKGVGFVGKAWEKGEILYTHDISRENDFLRYDAAVQNDIHSVICIPLKAKGVVNSVLCFLLNRLTEQDIYRARVLYDNYLVLQSVVIAGSKV